MPRVIPARIALLILGLVLGLPLAGALFAGRALAEFTRFPPPLEIPTDYVRFSWPAVAAVSALLVALTLSWVCGRRHSAPISKRPITTLDNVPAMTGNARFPLWGWVALTWTLAWWILAWTRWEWFEALQPYTFLPLWFGFIVSVNAATERQTGSCLMRRAPGPWLALFVASAACWWAFEWLNRFVGNWHYLNVENVGAWEYALHASACFSTVLPAVAAVAEWLGSGRRWNEITRQGPPWPWLARRNSAVVFGAAGCISLFATGVWPDGFYPALWVSPLALQIAVNGWSSRPSWVHEVARGDWRRTATWMVAALVCGFFWELYLPFGLECLLVTEWMIGDRWRSAPKGNSSTKAEPRALHGSVS